MERSTTKDVPSGDTSPSTPADWDRQFAAGAWSYLGSLNELAHHSVVAGYVAHLGKPASVLDVGCGEGNLRRLLPHNTRYLGTDWSVVAIKQARRREGDSTHFVVADAENYVPEQAFDIVIFNECLYYFRSAADTLNRYALHLKPGGHFIVSMYDTEGNQRIWQEIEANFTVLDRIRISNGNDTAWQIALLAHG
jgi:SAM-dependent methyltransferase